MILKYTPYIYLIVVTIVCSNSKHYSRYIFISNYEYIMFVTIAEVLRFIYENYDSLAMAVMAALMGPLVRDLLMLFNNQGGSSSPLLIGGN